MKDKVTVEINGEKFETGKIPIINYPQIFLAFENLPKSIVDMVSIEELASVNVESLIQNIIAKLPEIIAHSFNDIVNLIAVASNIDKQVIEQAGLDEIIDIVEAIIETNNIALIVSKVKNLKKTFQGEMKQAVKRIKK